MTEKPIVVGHDGSKFADQALRWAATLAAELSAPITVVRGWTYASAPRPATAEPGYVPPESDFADAVREKLVADAADVLIDFPSVTDVTYLVTRGAPANALIDASETARLVVVGPRGRGGFRGLVLGSVSEQVVRHAKCPVVVVRTAEDPSLTDRQLPA